MSMLKAYKSRESEERAYRHYRRNVTKLYNRLKESDIDEYTAMEKDPLYWLIMDIWSYWGNGFALPLIALGVELEKIDNIFMVTID